MVYNSHKSSIAPFKVMLPNVLEFDRNTKPGLRLQQRLRPLSLAFYLGESRGRLLFQRWTFCQNGLFLFPKWWPSFWCPLKKTHQNSTLTHTHTQTHTHTHVHVRGHKSKIGVLWLTSTFCCGPIHGRCATFRLVTLEVHSS